MQGGGEQTLLEMEEGKQQEKGKQSRKVKEKKAIKPIITCLELSSPCPSLSVTFRKSLKILLITLKKS